MALPPAEPQHPACGVCHGETDFDGDVFACYDCDIYFDPDTMEAAFLDCDAPVCGAACDNTWHRPHAIRPGHGYACGTCELPAGHTSQHWTDCQAVDLPCPDCWCPDHDSPRPCPEHGPPAGEHPANVCTHGQER